MPLNHFPHKPVMRILVSNVTSLSLMLSILPAQQRCITPLGHLISALIVDFSSSVDVKDKLPPSFMDVSTFPVASASGPVKDIDMSSQPFGVVVAGCTDSPQSMSHGRAPRASCAGVILDTNTHALSRARLRVSLPQK